jgi:uncharacterized UPF0146 family protein
VQAEAALQIGQAQDVVQVRSSAMVQWHDRRLVYVQRAPTEFAKQFVEVAGEAGDMVYLRPTLPKDGRVVVRGTQMLLSEEFKESIQLVEEGGSGGTPESGERGEK